MLISSTAIPASKRRRDDGGLIRLFDRFWRSGGSCVATGSRIGLFLGLVNVHSHSFQRAIRARTEHRTEASRDTFWTWREAYVSRRPAFAGRYLSRRSNGVSGRCSPPGSPRWASSTICTTRPPALAMKLQLAGRADPLRRPGGGVRIALLRTAAVRAGFEKPPNPGQARFITWIRTTLSLQYR